MIPVILQLFLIKCHDLQDEEIETLPKSGGLTYRCGQSSALLVLSSTFSSSSILMKATLIYLDTERQSVVYFIDSETKQKKLCISVFSYFATAIFAVVVHMTT